MPKQQEEIAALPKQFAFTDKQTDIRFQSLDEIKEKGLSIIYPNITQHTNCSNLKKMLINKHVTQAKLSQALCVPKGSLNKWIIKPDTMPLEYAIKIAKILDVPVEALFELNEEAWSFLYPVGSNYYLDLYTLVMVPAITAIKQDDGNKWYDTRSGEIISVKERRKREIRYIEENILPGDVNNRRKNILKEEFNQIIVPRYVRLVRKTKPFTI